MIFLVLFPIKHNSKKLAEATGSKRLKTSI